MNPDLGTVGDAVQQAGRPADRRVAAGSPADLVLLRVPLAEALAAPSADLVAATLIDGAVVSAT
jgi:hypothetical protein